MRYLMRNKKNNFYVNPILNIIIPYNRKKKT